MKIAVIGSLGLIGSSLISRLKDTQKVKIAELDIRYNEANENYLNITEPDNIVQKIQDCEGIIHLAAVSRVAWGEKNKNLCSQVNIEGTANIINACLSLKNKPWLIFASSREIYGKQNSYPVDEAAEPNPFNNYAKTKLIGEKLIEEAVSQKALKAAILRFSNVYGGGLDHIDRVVPAFCLNALKNQDIKIQGPNNILDFVYIDDAIEAIARMISLLANRKINTLYKFNISSAEPTSLLKLAELIISVSNSSSQIISLPKNSFAVDKFWGNNTLAQKILNWQPKFNLRSGIEKFVSFLRDKSQKEISFTNIYMRLKEDESFESYSWLPTQV